MALSRVTVWSAGQVLRADALNVEFDNLIDGVNVWPSSFVVGDMLYASTASALASLAAVATGNAVISGGVATAPSWGKIGLTTHVSGILPYANGGTNASTAWTAGSVIFAGASAYAQDNANLFWDNTNNRLGIGTATPRSELTISGDITDRGTLGIENADDDVQAGDVIGIIHFRSNESSVTAPLPADDIVARIHVVASAQHTAGQWPTDLAFSTLDESNELTEYIRLKYGGRVGIGTATPATSALLDLTSTTGALLVPRMTTTQRDALTPANGMVIYNTTTTTLQNYVAGAWASVVGGTGGEQHIWVDAASMIPRITNGPSRGYTEQATNDNTHESLDFDQTTSEGAHFKIGMPKSWDEGTVTFEPYWTASAGAGTFICALAGVATSNDDALDVAFGTAQTSTDTLILANDCHIGPESSAITIAGTPAANDMVTFQVTRDISDTLTADAKLLGILLHITTNADTDA